MSYKKSNSSFEETVACPQREKREGGRQSLYIINVLSLFFGPVAVSPSELRLCFTIGFVL